MSILVQGRNKTVDLANGFGTPNTEDRKNKCIFLYCVLHHLFLLLGDTTKSQVLFARPLSYKCQIYSVSLFSFHNFWSVKSMVFISCFYREGSWRTKCDYSEVRFRTMQLCLDFHFLIPFSTIHAIFLHTAFHLLCTMTLFFPKKICQLFSRGAQKICLLSASGTDHKELICRSCCWPCISKHTVP